MTALSNIPSEAISQLKEDLEWAEKHPEIFINMETYCESVGDLCGVCLGGAYVYRKLRHSFCLDILESGLRNAAFAGDSLRIGDLRGFLLYIGATEYTKYLPPGRFSSISGWTSTGTRRWWVDYQADPAAFHAQLNWLIESFEKLEEMLDD